MYGLVIYHASFFRQHHTVLFHFASGNTWLLLIKEDKILTGKCDDDYFGADCRHICHCVNGCDPSTGECLGADRRCLSGWSGQSCQKLGK